MKEMRVPLKAGLLPPWSLANRDFRRGVGSRGGAQGLITLFLFVFSRFSIFASELLMRFHLFVAVPGYQCSPVRLNACTVVPKALLLSRADLTYAKVVTV